MKPMNPILFCRSKNNYKSATDILHINFKQDDKVALLYLGSWRFRGPWLWTGRRWLRTPVHASPSPPSWWVRASTRPSTHALSTPPTMRQYCYRVRASTQPSTHALSTPPTMRQYCYRVRASTRPSTHALSTPPTMRQYCYRVRASTRPSTHALSTPPTMRQYCVTGCELQPGLQLMLCQHHLQHYHITSYQQKRLFTWWRLAKNKNSANLKN